MAIPQHKANPTPTALAKKYGQASNTPLLGTGKSGLTPVFLQPLFGAQYSQTRDDFDFAVREYQRQHLAFYTINELQDLGVIENPQAQLGDLQNPIHKLYARTLWRDCNVPLGHGLEGNWSVNHPKVWEVLLPCLRLASMFLGNIHVWPWFDALLLSPRDRIDTDEPNEPNSPPDRNGHSHLYEFGYRSLNIAAGSRDDKETKEMFEITAEYVQLWHFLDDPKHDDNRGLTEWFEPNAIHLGLHWKLVEPLLRDDLSVSERLVQQFRVTVMILHETAHALEIGRLYHERKKNPDNPWSIWEPFLEDEDFAELGYSMENAVFGGSVNGLVGDPGVASASVKRATIPDLWNEPTMGLVTESIPNHRIIDHYQYALKKGIAKAAWMIRNIDKYRDDPTINQESTFQVWPITIALIQNLNTTAYWTCVVAARGREAFRSSRIIGKLVSRNFYDDIYGEDFLRWKHSSPPRAELNEQFDGSQNGLRKWKFSHQDQTKSHVLRYILARQDENMRTLKLDQKLLEEWDMRPAISPHKGEGFIEWQNRVAEHYEQGRIMEELRQSIQERKKEIFGSRSEQATKKDEEEEEEGEGLTTKKLSATLVEGRKGDEEGEEAKQKDTGGVTDNVEEENEPPHFYAVQLSSLLDAHFETPSRSPSRSISPPKCKYGPSTKVDSLQPSTFKVQSPSKRKFEWRRASDSEREDEQNDRKRVKQ